MHSSITTETETQLYQCRYCGLTIVARLPAGLTGEFAHMRCEMAERGEDDSLLDAEVIGDE